MSKKKTKKIKKISTKEILKKARTKKEQKAAGFYF